jgi:hypothetical protein
MEPIIPPNRGITPEAAQALQNQGIPVDPTDIVSETETEANVVDAEIIDDGFSSPFPGLSGISSGDDIPDIEVSPTGNDGGTADASPRTSAVPRNRAKKDDDSFRDTASSRPPSLDEWTKFFSRIVLKVTCDWYLSYAFRGIDEDALSDREVERLALTDEEKRMVAIPFAELSNKSKFMRKHGRTIVSSGDAFNAMIVMGAWMSRVNRIASKYRPRVVKGKMNGASPNGDSRQGTQQASPNFEGTTGGRVNGQWRIFPGTS